MPRSRCPSVLSTALAVILSLAVVSCGGGAGGEDPDLVLLGFNLPNIAGVPLNEPLIFTFSAPIDDGSITPDTLRVVGAVGPFFEVIVVDGNLIALLPRSPNFEDYSDAGMAPATTYTVSMPVFPAVDTIKSITGKPLLAAETFSFVTVPTPQFIEPRRPIVHGPPPSQGGRSDDEGCLQNSEFQPPLFVPPGQVQTGSGPGARLVCLKNEGPPHIVESECIPRHNQQAFGTPSGADIGLLDFPAMRIRINEMVDPLTVVPYEPTTKLSLNVQLWRVGDNDGIPIPPEAIQVNKPLLSQSLEQTEIILVLAKAVQQGTYLINIKPDVKDLPRNSLVIADRPSPSIGGYQNIDAGLAGAGVPPGYRIYFKTLILPQTAQALNEGFGTNLSEWGDDIPGGVFTPNSEPGVFEQTVAQNPRSPIPGMITGPMTTPSFTLQYDSTQCGQTTTANWNGSFRFLNLPSLTANTDADGGLGRLKAVWRPYAGDGSDGALDTNQAPFNAGPGDSVGLGASADGDGIYEFESFHLRAGDAVSYTGTGPLLILCRGDFTVDGTIDLSGEPGGSGFDTDGTEIYTNPGAVGSGGAAGAAGAGGGAGGAGANVVLGQPNGFNGVGGRTVFGVATLTANEGPGRRGLGQDDTNQGGGGGGFGVAGGAGGQGGGGSAVNQGDAYGTALFERALTLFTPDRGYSPNANLSGGHGGGGGGAEDDDLANETGDGTANNGDDGGGGAGGGGGGLYVIAAGSVTVGATGVIRADGGDGGNTYDRLNQALNPGGDGNPGGGDDFIQGALVNAVPSGGGGGGGGGSGGGILLIGRTGVTVVLGATVSATGGTGGESGDPDRAGGDGGDGRIALGALPSQTVLVLAVTTPLHAAFTYNPTVDDVSVGQCEWIDLFTPTADFDPVVGGDNQPPFHTDNFQFLEDQGLTQGSDFDAVWEFQGAATLTPIPGGATPPSAATGLTAWSADPNIMDFKRYVRYRWRFFVSDGFPGSGPSALPMPQILDLTIPFDK